MIKEHQEEMERLRACFEGKERPVRIKEVSVDQIVFDERVKLKCFYCEYHDSCLKCPGNFPRGLSPEACIKACTRAVLVFQEYNYDPAIESGPQFTESARETQDTLLEAEKVLFKQGFALAACYFSGRCRQCGGCPDEGPCRNPSRARISIEGAGVDVKATMEKAGLSLSFDDPSRYKRVGLVCW